GPSDRSAAPQAARRCDGAHTLPARALRATPRTRQQTGRASATTLGHTGRIATPEVPPRLEFWCAHDEALRRARLSSTCQKYGRYLRKRCAPMRLQQDPHGLDSPAPGRTDAV